MMDGLTGTTRKAKAMLPSETARANRKKLEILFKGKIEKQKGHARPVAPERLGYVGDRGEPGYARQCASSG